MLQTRGSDLRSRASRVIAATVGGYTLTALVTVMLAVWLPLPRVEATIVATFVSFAVYAVIVLWVFAARSAVRAWSGVVIGSAVVYALLRFGQSLSE